MKIGPITRIREIRHAHLFCGIGGGAMGFNRAAPRVGNAQARFVCVGGIDVDAGARPGDLGDGTLRRLHECPVGLLLSNGLLGLQLPDPVGNRGKVGGGQCLAHGHLRFDLAIQNLDEHAFGRLTYHYGRAVPCTPGDDRLFGCD